jgi:CRP-like cAMP-binding protein
MIPTSLFQNSKDAQGYAAGAQVFGEGETGGHMFFVVDGSVEILVHGKVVETVGVGSMIGEMALIDKLPRSATARAATDSKLVAIDQRRFLFLVQETPFFAIHVMQVMADRLRRMNETIA